MWGVKGKDLAQSERPIDNPSASLPACDTCHLARLTLLPSEAFFHRDGLVYIVGGANSAGQAALHLAEYARAVTLVARSGYLGERMSQYLVERCEQHPRITVRTKSRVTRAIGNGRLEKLVIHNDASETDEEMPADVLFILIGGEPTSKRVADWLRLDENGFYLTGSDLLADRGPGPRWPLERQPFPLESSQPGVFVIGDARHGSIKRIASAVGDGALAVQFVHRYLAENGRAAGPLGSVREDGIIAANRNRLQSTGDRSNIP